MIKEDIKLSVVIPIYNVERYIRQCIDSVINQTYKNIEVILVDDGSIDRCPEICDEYALADSRVRVIHKENGGLSSARRAGIFAASGDYVMIVDGDDWIDDITIEFCVDILQRYIGLGCLLFSYKKERQGGTYIRHFFDDNKMFLSKSEFYKNVYLRFFGLTNDLLNRPEALDYLTSCCMKIYKLDFARCARFIGTQEVGSGEDGVFNIYALILCDSAIYVDMPFYHYRANENSITSSYRPNLMIQWSRLFEIMQDEINRRKLPSDFQEALNNRISLSILGIGLNALSNNAAGFSENRRYIKKYISSEIYRNAIHTTKIRKLPISWGVLLFCSKYKMAFFTTLILYIIKYIKTKL